MKALNIYELRTFAQFLDEILSGARLQEVRANDRGLALGFFAQGMHWLLCDLTPAAPVVVLIENECPWQKAAKNKPVGLFLNSHAKNLEFAGCRVLEEWGRVLRLELGAGAKKCEIEIHLIPKQVNFIVRTEDKAISWEKPRELKPALPAPELEERSLRQIQDEWLASLKTTGNRKAPQDPRMQWEEQKKKDLQKKSKALAEIEKTHLESSNESLYLAGEHLKSQGWTDFSADWEKFADRSQPVSWNIENIFRKAKQMEQKKQGALARVEQLRVEIEKLSQAQYVPANKNSSTSLDDLMQKTQAKGRKFLLASGALAYCGKSAQDNLLLLRQAKAWDFWLHLRDYPGAHAIVHRRREQNIPQEELAQVAQWLAQESLAAKSLIAGEKLAVVVAECRFVKPIKGDKLGRVTYHSEKHFVIVHGAQK